MIYLFFIPYLVGGIFTYLYPTWFFGDWASAKARQKHVLNIYRELDSESTDEQLAKSASVYHVINAIFWFPVAIYVLAAGLFKKS